MPGLRLWGFFGFLFFNSSYVSTIEFSFLTVRLLLRTGQNLPGIEKWNHASWIVENCLLEFLSEELRMKIEVFISFLSWVKISFLTGGQRIGSSSKKSVAVVLFCN